MNKSGIGPGLIIDILMMESFYKVKYQITIRQGFFAIAGEIWGEGRTNRELCYVIRWAGL